jgi:O-antigen/teichoic acid export membrane protein
MNIGFKSNIVLNLLFKFLGTGFGIYTTRWLTQNVSAAPLADFYVILAYTASLLQIISCGIPNLIHREYTNHGYTDKTKVLWSTMIFLRIVSYFVGLVIVLATYKLSGSENLQLIMMLFTVQFLLILDMNYRFVCDTMGRSWQYAISDFVSKFLLFLGLVFSGYGMMFGGLSNIYYYVLVCFVAYVTAILIDSVWQRKYTQFVKPQTKVIKKHARSMAIFTISGLALGLYLRTDMVFLRWFGYSNEVINGYSHAYKLLEVATMIPGLTVSIIVTRVKQNMDKAQLTKFGEWLYNKTGLLKSKSSQTKIIFEWFLLQLGFMVICTGFIALIGKYGIMLIDPTLKYPIAIDIFPLLSLSLIPLALMMYMGGILVMLGGEKHELFATLITMTVTLVLYVLLIKPFGVYGAALATIAGFTVDTISKMFFVRRYLDKNYNHQPLNSLQ